MRSGGITRRWVINTLSVIALILVVVNISAGVSMKRYYYQMAENTIDSKVQKPAVEAFFKPYIDSTDEMFQEGAREFVENFDYSYLMEVWVLDSTGKPIVNSAGFSVVSDKVLPDFSKAVSDGGTGLWMGKNHNREKVLVKTFLITNTSGETKGAVRLIVSLEDLDRQHMAYTVLITLLCTIAFGLVAFSGSFFIRSIVRPVGRINEAAKLIAKGDFNARVEFEDAKDEISELCSTVNYMSEEIARSDKVKNDFISTVSHELRTPLTAIKGWAETIRDMDPSDAEMTEKGIDVIISEADRLYNIVEDLLDFSKMQSGRMVVRAEPLDAFAELTKAVNVFMDRAKREGINLEYHQPSGSAPISADKSLLKQVFANVLDNAFKYTKSGGTVSVYAEKSGRMAMIAISDTGCGISREDLPHITEKFYKANMSVRGSGIGLAVVDEIINLHGGKLDVASEVGIGTVVTVILPIDKNINLN